MQDALVLGQGFFQSMQLAEVIFLSKEAAFSIVTTLHDVHGNSIEVDAWAEGHGATLACLIRAWPL